jgi:hypothetical protein
MVVGAKLSTTIPQNKLDKLLSGLGFRRLIIFVGPKVLQK